MLLVFLISLFIPPSNSIKGIVDSYSYTMTVCIEQVMWRIPSSHAADHSYIFSYVICRECITGWDKQVTWVCDWGTSSEINQCCTSNSVSQHKNKPPCLTLTKGTLFLSSCTERLVFVTVEEKESKHQVWMNPVVWMIKIRSHKKDPIHTIQQVPDFVQIDFKIWNLQSKKLPVRLHQHYHVYLLMFKSTRLRCERTLMWNSRFSSME